MKKILFLAVLVVAIVALAAGTAFAGSWWIVNSNKAGDVPNWNTASNGLSWALDTIEYGSSAARADNFYYRNNGGTTERADRLSINNVTNGSFAENDRDTLSAGTPHGGFSTTTGYCKTCHAIHEAGTSSYRLLKSGSQEPSVVDYANSNLTADGNSKRTSGEGLLENYPGKGPGNTADDGFGTSRSNECMYCHDADAGFSPMRPYALSIITVVRGEHTIGATHVPDRDGVEMRDRDANDPTDGGSLEQTGTLQCYQCHSVHGSDTLGELTVGNSKWGDKIIRLDPNGDGVKLGQDAPGAPIVTHGTVAGQTAANADKEEDSNVARTAFCGDCHRGNGNWDTNAADDLLVGGKSFTRPNATSHIQGPADDGTMEVYGTDMKVAWDDYKFDDNHLDAATATEGDLEGYNGNTNAAETHTSTPKSGCRGCHSAEDHGNEQKEDGNNWLQSNWPHQSIGPKLLNDALGLAQIYTDGIVYSSENNVGGVTGNDAGVVGDSDRQLINMDAICLRCHRNNRGGLIIDDTAGVGITF